jgi:diphthine methyl ester synthase
MVFYVIGLGLGDEKDITVRGLEIVKKCSRVYLEYYTSILGIDNQALSEYYGRPVVLADRTKVENEADSMYMGADKEDVAFLVVGDALCATTHTDLMLRVKQLGIKVEVVHNTSIMGAVASCGLQLYQFGYTVSIPLFEGEWRPDSFYDRIKYNQGGGMHTLCLLDIKVKEPDFESMCMGKMRFLPPRFMTVNTAIHQLLEVEDKRGDGVVTEDHLACGLARLGQPTQLIVYGTLKQLLEVDFGPPLHSLALCGEMHPLETDVLEQFRVTEEMMTGTGTAAREVEEEANEAKIKGLDD